VPSREEKRWLHHKATREMREIRKQVKRNRKPKRVRHKDWMPDDCDDPEIFGDSQQTERIMPRGERERRRTIEATVRAALENEDPNGNGDQDEQEIDNDGDMPVAERVSDLHGIVVEVSSSLCRVALKGRRLICGIRGSLSVQDTGFTNVVAVGDQVVVSEDGSGRGIVEAVLPRRTILARHDVFCPHLQQVIVANADQLLVVASWRAPHFWPELVDRYLIAAERNDLYSIICVNKVDLAEDVAICRAELQPYINLGHRVIFTSALTGEGVGKLRETLRGRTTVLAGMSGVGKSSLLNAVQPGLQIVTREVSDHSYEGRHATTQVSMNGLEVGGFVVDTPGIREFGLSGLLRAELVRFYPEIATLGTRCRFNDCSHTHEPGCAVKAAVQTGQASAVRYHSYTCIYDSLPD
jgi:ribosome biogenesis GTPase